MVKVAIKPEFGSPKKPVTSCLSPDRIGFTRPIFLDNLCDGYPECPNGEDEGEMVKCKFAGDMTPNGCCAYPIIGDIKCSYTGSSNDSGLFSNQKNKSSALAQICLKARSRI